MVRLGAFLMTSLLIASPAAALMSTPAALTEDLQTAQVGQILTLPFSSNGTIPMMNGFPNSFARSGGVLLYSDDPETVTAPGVLYQDTVPAGSCRVYLYHVSSLAAAMRCSVVIENPGATPVTITPTHRAVVTPSGNYLAVGRELSRRVFDSSLAPGAFSIPAGGRALLDSALDSQLIQRNQLLAASLDFTATGNVRVSTVMVAQGVDTLATFPQLTLSPADSSMRQGTFPLNDRTAIAAGYRWNASAGLARFRIGESGSALNDPPAPGTDAERANIATTLPGNYGIQYDIRMTYNNDTGQRGAILLNPRGGNYGGWFRVTMDDVVVGEGLVPSGTLVVPPTTGAGVVALMDGAAGEHELRLQFTPAGASALPIELLFVPYTYTPPPSPTQGWVLVQDAD